jgi:hypothetical protein
MLITAGSVTFVYGIRRLQKSWFLSHSQTYQTKGKEQPMLNPAAFISIPITQALFSISFSQQLLPMPEPAPVTIYTFPSKFII